MRIWQIYRRRTVACVLSIRQSKTGAGVTLPVDLVPHLACRIEEEIARTDARFAGWPVKPAQLIVYESTGRAYTGDHFRHPFAEIRAAAAELHPSFEVNYPLPGRGTEDPEAFTVRMADLWFMHLRHTAVVRRQEAECDHSLIAAVTGHAHKSISTIIERYGMRTRKLAGLAVQKRLTAKGNGFAADGSGETRALPSPK